MAHNPARDRMAHTYLRSAPPVLPEATDAQIQTVARLASNVRYLSASEQRRVRKLLRLAHDALKHTEH